MIRSRHILYVTSHWPFASSYGAQQRTLNLLRLLSRFGHVSLVIVDCANPVDEDAIRRTGAEFDLQAVVRTLPTAPDSLRLQLKHRFRHEFDPSYLGTEALGITDADRRTLIHLIGAADVTWIHSLRVADACGISVYPRCVLDVDDIPSRFYFSEAQSGRTILRRMLDLRMSLIWRRRERLLRRRFDVVTVCSEDDRRYLGNTSAVHIVPNGFSPVPRCPRIAAAPPRIGFIGTFRYRPNRQGVAWFIKHIWPLIRSSVSDVELRLIGFGGEGFTNQHSRITGLGWLEDPTSEMATWSAMIVPIQAGGGTRIKIAEGFARGVPVVSTTTGVFGYNVCHEREILISDHPEAFGGACTRLLQNPELGEGLAQRAYRRFLQEWTWDSFEDRVGAALEHCGLQNQPFAMDQPVAIGSRH